MVKIIAFIIVIFLLTSLNVQAKEITDDSMLIKNNKQQVKKSKNSSNSTVPRKSTRKSKSCPVKKGKLSGCGSN